MDLSVPWRQRQVRQKPNNERLVYRKWVAANRTTGGDLVVGSEWWKESPSPYNLVAG